MKIFKYLLLVSMTLIVIGCGDKNPNPEHDVVVVTKVKKIYIETGCKVPNIDCDFTGDGFEPTVKLLECVSLQKHVLDSLKEQSDKNTTKVVEETLTQ